MTGARGDALDWALALARAPGERLVLRQRPLPEGLDDLLQIAAGHRGEALAGAVVRSGESEQVVVETVRFYLREILFHSSADAYRVLASERRNSAEQIKGHHRWLQQWLHPDRHTSDWDAIFAGRVNAAWNQLRTEERRRAYDAEQPAERTSTTVPTAPVMAGLASPPLLPQSPWQRWQRRAPLLALTAACAVLGVHALRDLARDEALLAREIGSAQPALADPRQLGDATLDAFGNLHIPEGRPPSKGKVPVARAGAPLPPPRPIDRRAPASPAVPIAIASRAPVRNPTARVHRVALQPGFIAPPVISAASARRGTSTHPQAVSLRPRPVDVPPAGAPPPLPQPPVSVASSAASATSTTTQVTAPVSAERVRQAQQVGARLVTFMGRPGTSTPPIWDSPDVQQGAGQLRDSMLADGRPGIGEANWRVGEGEARMRVAIRHSDGRNGYLNAVLVWREQRWLVRRLSMERDG